MHVLFLLIPTLLIAVSVLWWLKRIQAEKIVEKAGHCFLSKIADDSDSVNRLENFLKRSGSMPEKLRLGSIYQEIGKPVFLFILQTHLGRPKMAGWAVLENTGCLGHFRVAARIFGSEGKRFVSVVNRSGKKSPRMLDPGFSVPFNRHYWVLHNGGRDQDPAAMPISLQNVFVQYAEKGESDQGVFRFLSPKSAAVFSPEGFSIKAPFSSVANTSVKTAQVLEFVRALEDSVKEDK